VRIGSPSEEDPYGIKRCEEELITIWESLVYEYLYSYLKKYFDADLPIHCDLDRLRPGTFEWNLEHNLYHRSTLQLMLEEIRAEKSDEPFCREFCERMELMLQRAPEYDWFSFSGP